jgi:hypothetical protein
MVSSAHLRSRTFSSQLRAQFADVVARQLSRLLR